MYIRRTGRSIYWLILRVLMVCRAGGRQFALDLLRERNVAVASGNNFGSVAENYVRISLAASEEEIERGVREICAFADR
ncbi:MAG TPA: hypothetical protein VKB35_17795 [Ktedonobacteraceae bacterium]|nr:hypothetical protein [Ktedonobacteraceae bacterium]